MRKDCISKKKKKRGEYEKRISHRLSAPEHYLLYKPEMKTWLDPGSPLSSFGFKIKDQGFLFFLSFFLILFFEVVLMFLGEREDLFLFLL